jgi:hypothetical protein
VTLKKEPRGWFCLPIRWRAYWLGVSCEGQYACHCERSEAIAPEQSPNGVTEQVRLLRCARNDKRFLA